MTNTTTGDTGYKRCAPFGIGASRLCTVLPAYTVHTIRICQSCTPWIKFSLCQNGYKRVFKEFLTTSGEAQFQLLHTLALLCGKWQTLGSVWWVASAADAGARATVRGTGHFAAHWRTLPWWREWGCLSSEVVSVLSGKAEENAWCYNLNGAKIRNVAFRDNELFSSYKTILDSCKPISATIFFRGWKTQEPFCFCVNIAQHCHLVSRWSL